MGGFGVSALHFYGLTSSPPGFFLDEAWIGYNAYTISIDGRDENGASWPLIPVDHMNPVLVYLLAGMMRLFGPSVGIVRMAPSLLSLCTAIVLGLLAYRMFRNRWLGLATFVAAGTLPWLFVIGRIGFEVSALPTALSLFLLAWWSADQESRPRRQLLMALLAGLSLGVALYAYTTARLLVLMLVAVLWVAYLGTWSRQWRPLAVTTVVALLSYVPLALWSLRYPGKLTARFNEISILCRPVSSCVPRPEIVGTTDDGMFFPLVVAERLLRVYRSGWSPSYLFYTGDPLGRHVTGHGGMLFVTLAPFLIVGAVALVRRWKEPYWRFIGLATIVAGIPAALTAEQGHSLRLISVVPFLVVIMALGAAVLIRQLSGQRWIAAALCGAVLIEAAWFMTDYFTAYPARQASWFDAGLQSAITRAEQAPHQGPIRLSDQIGWYAPIMFRFFTQEDPRIYRASGIAGGGAVVEPVAERPLPPESVVVAKPEENVLNAELLQTVTVDGEDGWGHRTQIDVYKIWLTR